MPKVILPFHCLLQEKDYNEGDIYEYNEEREKSLQERGFLEILGGTTKKVVKPKQLK